MSNFKHPQYLTPKGFARTAKKPGPKNLSNIRNIIAKAAPVAGLQTSGRLRLLAEKRVMAQRVLQRQKEGISEEAAKMIAEAIKTMLRS